VGNILCVIWVITGVVVVDCEFEVVVFCAVKVLGLVVVVVDVEAMELVEVIVEMLGLVEIEVVDVLGLVEVVAVDVLGLVEVVAVEVLGLVEVVVVVLKTVFVVLQNTEELECVSEIGRYIHIVNLMFPLIACKIICEKTRFLVHGYC
jgi:hypothetical protein